MGTRNLTMVISNKETKVAQFGQYDGYPSGQGATALEFLLNNDLTEFREKLNKVKFVDDKKQKEIDKWLKSIGCENGYLDTNQSALYKQEYPLLTRDNGAKVLQMIMDSQNLTLWLHDQSEFAADSLFCEWAYVIDLDKGYFEIYEGFNKRPLGKTQRFKYLEDKAENGYSPIRMVKKYDINNLPTEEQFLKDFKENDEEE